MTTDTELWAAVLEYDTPEMVLQDARRQHMSPRAYIVDSVQAAIEAGLTLDSAEAERRLAAMLGAEGSRESETLRSGAHWVELYWDDTDPDVAGWCWRDSTSDGDACAADDRASALAEARERLEHISR